MCMGGWGRQPYLADVIIQRPCWACQLPSPSLLWPLTHPPTHPSKCTTIPSNYVAVLLDINVSHSKSNGFVRTCRCWSVPICGRPSRMCVSSMRQSLSPVNRRQVQEWPCMTCSLSSNMSLASMVLDHPPEKQIQISIVPLLGLKP